MTVFDGNEEVDYDGIARKIERYKVANVNVRCWENRAAQFKESDLTTS